MGRGEQFESVLRAARAGAEWALTALYRDLHPRLLRYLRVQEPREAEDLASEVWLDVAAGLGRFEGDETAFRAWLFTIARRRIVDLRRRNGRRRADDVAVGRLETLPASLATEDEMLAAIAADDALARIARLPRDQAEVVLLRVLAGLDVERVAAIMGRRPGSVRVLQHRALRRLAQELAPPDRNAARVSSDMEE